MAVMFYKCELIGRAHGRRAVSTAAWRHSATMRDDLWRESYCFAGKSPMPVFEEIILPDSAPEWAVQRYGGEGVTEASERLWNDVELRENQHSRRAQAQLAQSYTVALPRELSLEQNVALIRGYIRDNLIADGAVADLVVHDKGDGNPHAHIMTTMRTLGAAGLDQKIQSYMNRRQDITDKRFGWACYANYALERAGFEARIDHRRLEEQGIELEPTSYDPFVAANAEEAGQPARKKERALEARKRNAALLVERPEHILVVLGARQAVFTEKDLERALLERLDGSAEEVSTLMGRVMASSDLVQIEAKTPDGQAQYGTRAREVLETNLVVDGLDLAGRKLSVDGAAGLEMLSGNLRRTQRAAAEAMLSPERLTLVTGFAGTGKTHTLHEVAKVWKSRGYEVIGGAASGKATQELSGIADMEAASLAAWEARWARGRVPSDKFVFIMDEAGMVGADVWLRVQAKIATLGGKFIAVGDPEQLQPVNDTNAFLAIQDRIGVTVMDEVVRQSNPLERQASREFALGGVAAKTAVRYYADAGAIEFTNGEDEAIEQIAAAYFEKSSTPENRLAVALSNKDVWGLNDALRKEALDRSVVTAERNFGEIERIERDPSRGDKRIHVPLMVGAGDRLLFTKAHSSLRVPKSSLATVTAVRDGEIDLRLDGTNRAVTVDMTEFSSFDYGFATTIHKSQGMTVDRAFVLGHGYMNQHLIYVAMSRHRESVTFYAPRNRIKSVPDLEALAAKKGYLKFDVAEHPERIHERFGAAVEHGEAATRADYSGSAVAVEDTRFEGDAHLLGVMSRIGGLLASEYVEGDPIIGDDPKGYGQEPTRVVDDLVARRSVFSAADVANVLSGVVNEPDTFVRLFREAMEHPDLIVLRDDTVADPVRLFTTKAQLGLELDVVDRAARLALLDEQRGPAVGARAVERASATYDLSDEQCAALDVAAHGRINIISGASGSGKSRIAAALGEAHEASGWDVVRVAPTGIGADNLRAASLDTAQVRTVRTLASLEYGIEQGRIELGPRSVLIMDEAGQVGAQTADRLLRLVEESGAKLIALRDNDQLGPYEAGPVFQALEARIGGTELGASQRSENALLSGIVERLSAPDMNADEAALDLRSAGVLKAGGTRVDSIEAVAQDYLSDPNPKKVALAHGREDVAALNRAIRAGLDAAVPERALEPSADGAEGALANLRQRDKIVLASSYNADGNWLRAGTAFEVERRSDNEVVLRHGDGHEAQYLKLDVADQDFEYRFGFATTVHGSKGRSIDSVHMLATPGMSKHISAQALACTASR